MARSRYVGRMGKSNLLLGLERKVGTPMGEPAAKLEEIERAEKLVEALPTLRDRIWEIDTLISATEALLREIKPGWTRALPDRNVAADRRGHAGRERGDLNEIASRSQFIQGNMSQPDHDGVYPEVLIWTCQLALELI